jgi:hypothetical protein
MPILLVFDLDESTFESMLEQKAIISLRRVLPHIQPKLAIAFLKQMVSFF